MLPSIAKPTSGSSTTATIMDSMITTMPRRPGFCSEDLPVINPRTTHVLAPRKIGRTEVRLGEVRYLASGQSDQASKTNGARGGIRQVVRRWDIPAGADEPRRGISEGAR